VISATSGVADAPEAGAEPLPAAESRQPTESSAAIASKSTENECAAGRPKAVDV
jgi:hypothetical protein